MKTLVIYDSLYGNTRHIAEAIADTCRPYGEVRFEQADVLTSIDTQGEDLLFIGCPTHNQNLSPAMKLLLDATPKQSLRGVKAAAFDTRYDMPGWLLTLSAGTAANKLAGKVRALGAKTLVRPESFLIKKHHEGPLQAGELERAKTWAKTVLEKAYGQPPTTEMSSSGLGSKGGTARA